MRLKKPFNIKHKGIEVSGIPALVVKAKDLKFELNKKYLFYRLFLVFLLFKVVLAETLKQKYSFMIKIV